MATLRLLAAVVIMSGLLLAGCRRGPQAPALSDAPIYNNREEGFRFLVPDGWTQSANADLPNETLEKEVLLVQYRMKTAKLGATLEILVFDEPEPSDLAAYHQLPSQAVSNWKLEGEPEEITINGMKAQRFNYKGSLGNQPMEKEVVAFRRGNRVYSFIGLFWAGDINAHEQLRRAVGSVIWS
jgi:hypothetical protein